MKRRMVQEGWRNGGSNFTRHCDPEEIERSNLMMEDENHFGSVITPTEGNGDEACIKGLLRSISLTCASARLSAAGR